MATPHRSPREDSTRPHPCPRACTPRTCTGGRACIGDDKAEKETPACGLTPLLLLLALPLLLLLLLPLLLLLLPLLLLLLPLSGMHLLLLLLLLPAPSQLLSLPLCSIPLMASTKCVRPDSRHGSAPLSLAAGRPCTCGSNRRQCASEQKVSESA